VISLNAVLTAPALVLVVAACGQSGQPTGSVPPSAHLSAGGWRAEQQVLLIGGENPGTSASQAVAQCRQIASIADSEARTISALCADSATTVGGLKQMLTCRAGTSVTPACAAPALRATASSLRDYGLQSRRLSARLRGGCRQFFSLGLDRNQGLADASSRLAGDLAAGGAAAAKRADLAAWQRAEQRYAAGVGLSPARVRTMVESCRP
jgi:hypothetical protein